MITPTKEFWEIFKSTNGALSVSESIFIMQAAALAPKGRYIECGVAYGKSAMSALVSLKEYKPYGEFVEFVLVDPLFKDLDVCNMVIQKIKNATDKIMGYNFDERFSTEVIPIYDNYAYAMLDSGDHDQTIIDEFNLIKDRMVSGGVVVLHDLDSQFIRVREVYDMFLATGNYEEIKADWEEINAYVDENNLEEGNLSWHHQELKNPNFVGALRRK